MSKIIGITVGTTTNPKKVTKGYVPNTRKIAGFELSDDISVEDLLRVLGLEVDQTYKPESEAPQSGKAVAEAVADALDGLEDFLASI